MAKHPYDKACDCPKCARERARRERQSTTAGVMLDWTVSRNPRRARIAREYWDAYESGHPMSDDDR